MKYFCRIFVLLMLGQILGIAQESGFAPTPERALETIFKEGLLSTYFDSQVREIADHYAEHSGFAGNVRVNEAPQKGALQIYIFNYSDKLDPFLANNCNSFPNDHVIFCDHRLLDSIPASPPVIAHKGQRIPPPFLMFWIIGHEIGHVVLGHNRGAFLGFEPSATLNSSEMIHQINPLEVAADRFAISSLPLSSPDDWLYFGGPLVDAIGWELPKLNPKAYSDLDSSSSFSSGDSHKAKVVQVRVWKGDHPPLIMRLYDLLSTIRSVYSTFPYGDSFIPPVVFKVSKAIAPEYGNNLFYGGYYVGHHQYDENGKAHSLLDRAIYMNLMDQQPFAKWLQDFACKHPAETSDVWRWEYSFACGPRIEQPATNPLKLLSNCSSMGNDEALRCYGLIPLFGLAVKGKYNLLFSTPLPSNEGPTLKELDGKFSGFHFPVSRDFHELGGWFLLSRYLYEQVENAVLPDSFDEWLVAVAVEDVENNGRTGWELLTQHEKYLLSLTTQDGWIRVCALQMTMSDLADSVGNDDWAVAFAREAVAIIRQHIPPESPLHGVSLRRLARVLRRYGTPRVGTSDPTVFGAFDQERTKKLETAEKIRAESALVSESAALAFQRSWIWAKESKKDPELAQGLHEGYLNALGDVVYSYNMSVSVKSGENVDKAYFAARKLLTEIAAAPELQARKDFAVRVLAPAFENCADAVLGSSKGDAQEAIDLSKKARDIRKAAGEKNIALSLRLLAYAFYRLGDPVRADQVAREFLENWELSYGRHYELQSGALVAGKVVEFRTLLKN